MVSSVRAISGFVVERRAAVFPLACLALVFALPCPARAACGDHVTVSRPARQVEPETSNGRVPSPQGVPCDGLHCRALPAPVPLAPVSAPTLPPDLPACLCLPAAPVGEGAGERLDERRRPRAVRRAAPVERPPRAVPSASV